MTSSSTSSPAVYERCSHPGPNRSRACNCTLRSRWRRPTSTVAGNNTGMMVVRLPLGDGDPRPRLAAIHAETAAAKRGQPATAGTRFLVWLARSGLMRQVTRHQHLTNTVVSDVIGPRSPITFLGTPIIDLIPVGPLAGNLASAFLAFSYAGALTVTVHVDADRFGDLDILTDAMSSEWRRLASDVTTDRASARASRLAPAADDIAGKPVARNVSSMKHRIADTRAPRRGVMSIVGRGLRGRTPAAGPTRPGPRGREPRSQRRASETALSRPRPSCIPMQRACCDRERIFL